ncbi:type III secretion system protein [Erwinia amylovora]|uniref:type III secretion system protein n=1 Tax=Erwinia amylovora TaxID=552 RepID=UPI0014444479|nr:type III secretion system protein [Erwinia amylovora]
MTSSINIQASAYINKPEPGTTKTPSGGEISCIDWGKGVAQEFVGLASSVPLQDILSGQSLRADHTTVPTLSAPSEGAANISAEQQSEVIKMAENVRAPDANTLEQLAASASTALTSDLSNTQFNNRTVESHKTSAESAIQTSASTNPARSQAAVGGGTDITAVGAFGPKYVNMVGDTKLLETDNSVSVSLTKSEAQLNKNAAKAQRYAVEAANRSGNNAIAAAKLTLNGVITGGVLGTAVQAGTTLKTTNALHNESKSIDNNLRVATKLQTNVHSNENSIARSGDNMVSNGKRLDRGAEAAMSQSHGADLAKSSELRDNHSVVQNNTQKVRTISEFANQVNRSGQGVVEGTFNVEASKESKQADLARADQNVNNELSSTHQQTAKKSAETKAALNQALENTLNNNNSAASAIAERMR